jgi:hypothetical protein
MNMHTHLLGHILKNFKNIYLVQYFYAKNGGNFLMTVIFFEWESVLETI